MIIWTIGTILIWTYAVWLYLQDQASNRPRDIFVIGAIWPLFVLPIVCIIIALTSFFIIASILTAFSNLFGENNER